MNAIGSREKQLFNKLNRIGKNEEVLLYQKTANETLRYGIDVAVDMSTRGRTDKTPWNSFTIPKFYNLVTTGDTKPRTASASSSGAGSAGGGGGGGGW